MTATSAPASRSRIRRLFSWLWSAVNGARKVAVNLLFLAIVVGLVILVSSGKPSMPAEAALIIAPRGRVVEQIGRPSGSGWAQQAVSGKESETLLRDLVDALAAARDDHKISSVYLDLSELEPSGMTVLEDLRAALLDFRKSGKKVVAYGDSYAQGPYYLATAADEIWLSPLGGVTFEGLGRFHTFYKEALDRLEVDVHVFRVGEFKSAVEPYLRNDASPEAKQADLKWMGDLWSAWLRDVAEARHLKTTDLSAYITNGPANVEAVKGDFAKLAIDQKLVDKLGYRDEVTERMVALAGEDKEDKKERTFRHVSVKDYLELKGGDRDGRHGGDAVAVIVAAGEILDGKQPPGTIGGDSLAELIRKVRNDKKVKAIVLRVVSPGGSAFASEVIRRELVLAQKGGKKVVVSMGAVAASGGYWISTASDEIWASPETITGSIGIFGVFPTVDRTLAHFIGVHSDGVGTTPYAGGIAVDRPLLPELGRMIQAGINHGYEEFVARVAEARKMSSDDVDKIARGRVWSGADAHNLKLVDHLGGLREAIASAGKLAGLPAGFRVYWAAPEKKLLDKMVEDFFEDSEDARAQLGWGSRPSPIEEAVTRQMRALADLARWNDPHHAYVYCPCELSE